MFDDQPKDWIMSTDRRLLFTDQVLDWEASEALMGARQEWDNGKYYPSVESSSAVLLQLCDAFEQLQNCPEKLKLALMEIGLFLAQPTQDKLPIIVGHALDVQRSFLDGGLIRDALTTLASTEKQDVKDFPRV